MLSCHRCLLLPSNPFPTDFSTKTSSLYISAIRAIRSAHLNRLALIICLILDGESFKLYLCDERNIFFPQFSKILPHLCHMRRSPAPKVCSCHNSVVQSWFPSFPYVRPTRIRVDRYSQRCACQRFSFFTSSLSPCFDALLIFR